MSDHLLRFIPDDPDYALDTNQINQIKQLDWCGSNARIDVNETVQFADAGENFETVSCPFCNSDLMGWWGETMSAAYSDENGFTHMDVITPCCIKATTLQDLIYSPPQGFYKSIIEIRGPAHPVAMVNPICSQLAQITNASWRVIHAHY